MSFIALTSEPGVRVRLLPGWRLAKSPGEPSFVLVGPPGETPPFARWAEDFASAGALLAEGAPLAELRDAVIRAGGAERGAGWMLFLQDLNRWGYIDFPLVDETGERATLLPQWEGWAPHPAPEPPPNAELDRFACLRRDAGAWLLESPLVGARLKFADLAALDASIVRRTLAGAGFFAAPPADGARRDAMTQWEFHDLSFHIHNRRGFHRDPCGGVFPFIGEIPPPPARRPPWPGERIPLARAPVDAGGESFAGVLERRRSVRHYDEERPISLRDLGALLDRAARVREFHTLSIADHAGKTSPYEVSTRPYPNGGASYELEIYPAIDRCDGLDAGLYHYDAADHALRRVSGRTPDVDGMFADAHFATGGMAKPQIVLAIAARFSRVMWKYRSIAYGVILRNTGALYGTLYLAATGLGLSPCGIGSGDTARFARATGLDPLIEGTVGDFILGGRPASDPPPDPRRLPRSGGADRRE